MKGTPGPRLDAHLVRNGLEAFLLYINENMITKIVERTNDQMGKVRKKINADESVFRYSDTNREEIKCLFGLGYLRGLYNDNKQPTKELWYDTFSARKIYSFKSLLVYGIRLLKSLFCFFLLVHCYV